MQPMNTAIQSTSLDLLQVLVARGEVDDLSIKTIETAVIQKLFFCVHFARLDLQNKLLHLLHSLLLASISPHDSQSKNVVKRPGDGAYEDNFGPEAPHEPGRKAYPISALLVQTLVDGIATPTNRPIHQQWLDFILTSIPQFQPTLQSILTPLNDCLCRQLRAGLADVLHISESTNWDSAEIPFATTDAELIALLNGLERLTLLCLASTPEAIISEDENVAEKPGTETGGLLGLVSNVFSSDAPSTEEDQLTARSPGYRALHESVRVLFAMWATLVWPKSSSPSPKDDSLSMIFTRTRIRCRRVLEHFYHVHPAEVFESVVDCWNRERLHSKATQTAAFELVDVLIANATNAVHMICESIICRVAGVSEKSKKQAINPNLSDATLFEFLEHYLDRLEGPLALQVWGRFIQLARDISGSSRDLKAQNYPALRCLSVLAEKITQTTAMEDRRIRKELQEYFGKLLDSCVVYVGRSLDQGTWIRRGAQREILATNGRDSPLPRAESKLKLDEKTNASSTSLPDATKASASLPDLSAQINQFLAATALPHLRKFLMDNDKVSAACTNIFYYIVTPSMKSRPKPLELEDPVLDIVREMTKITPALKAWRGPITDLFNDNRFFSCNVEIARKWKAVMKALVDADKTAFPELLAKVTTAPSANIFTNREYEMLLRSLNIRRLSYILFTGEKNHFLTYLPTIQEKLVDILKNVSTAIVQSEVYLCIRVLLCRLSPHNLTSFWPVLLTELYRVFEQVMMNLPADGSEDLPLILSACKCLDLLLVLQTEEFQLHQWIFITDTVDAIYRPDRWSPQAMMDQLSEIAGNLPVAESRENASSSSTPFALQIPTPFPGARPLRRPMLHNLRQIDSIRDLVPFFSHVSIASYESMYASGGHVDWEMVESGLMDDMFEGQ